MTTTPLRPALGLALLGIGAVLLVQQITHGSISIIQMSWPVVPLLVGLGLFTLVALGGRNAAPLAVPAAMVTIAGAILFVQYTTQRFETWAYAHSLVFPAATGVGLWLWGLTDERPRLVRFGRLMAVAGLALFAIGALFFEGVIWRGLVQGGTVVALMLILPGVYLMFRPRAGARVAS